MAGVYILLMVANAKIDQKCDGESKFIHTRFILNIVLTILACFIYMFFINTCNECFNMKCPG